MWIRCLLVARRPAAVAILASVAGVSCHALSLVAGRGVALAAVAAAEVKPDSLPALRIFTVETLQQLPAAEREAAFTAYVLAARAALARRDFGSARQLADRACSLWKRSRRPLVHRAAAELGLQHYGDAIASAREASRARADKMPPAPRADEGPGAAAYWEGVALYQTRRYDEALPRLVAAMAAAPEWAEAARAHAELCFVMLRREEAASSYARAFTLDPEVGSARDDSYYAETLVARGDLDGGIAMIQRALRRSPYTPGLHANLGRLLRQEGDLTEAYYQFTLELLLHGLRGPYAQETLEAAGQVVDIVRTTPEHPGRHELLLVSTGIGYLDEERAHRAVHELEHAKRITRSASGLPQLLLGEALLRSRQAEAARRELESVLRLQPEFVPALVLLSEALRALGEREQAQITIDRAYALFPDYWRLHRQPQ